MNTSSFSRIQTRHIALLLILLGLAVPALNGARRSQAQEGPTPLVPTRETYGRARVTAGSLNLRTGPHVSYTAIAYLMEGEEVQIVGRNRTSTWVQIRLYNGYRGWVHAAYIRPDVAIDALPIIDVSLLGITAFVTNDPIPVYTGPGAGYQLIDYARPGDVLALNGRDAPAAWVHVYLPDGRAGWAAAGSSFLPSGTINDLPIIAPFLDAPPPDLSPFFLAYSGPGFLYNPVASVEEGQTLGIIARTADSRWIQVRLPNGREGWIAAEIVHIDAALANVPVVVGIAPPEVVGWMPSRPPVQSPPAQPTEEPAEQATAQPTEEPTEEPTQESGPTPSATPGGRQTPAQATTTPTATGEATRTTTATAGAGTATVTPEPTGEANITPPAGIPIVYVYATPGEDSPPVSRVVPGQSVVLIGRSADAEWIKIWLPGDQEGWVRTDALQLDIDVTVLPIVEP